MSIRAVFRVRCDGPCKGWLSLSPEFAGRDILPGMMTVEPTAVHAANWPGERAAREAARQEGFQILGFTGRLLCPECRDNPLGIKLPSARPNTEKSRPPACEDPEVDVDHSFDMTWSCVFCGKDERDL